MSEADYNGNYNAQLTLTPVSVEAAAADQGPSTDNGPETEPTSVLSDLHPHYAGHHRNGQFAARNTEAVTHGGGRRQPILNPEQTELYATWARDLGGSDELTAAERVLVQRGVEADAIAAGAIRYLHRSHQSLTHPRTLAAIDVWSSATAQLRSLAIALGLRRRQKQVDPFEAVQRAVAEATARTP